jgi:hypothetical protein
MKTTWSVKTAKAYVKNLSLPSKMPGYSYSIPAQNCKVGGQLQKIEGSTCSKCYCLRGNYRWPVVENALKARLKAIKKAKWVEAMAFLINNYGSKGDTHFRFHDSGDLQSMEHLENIVSIAKLTPLVKIWLPTREYKLIRDYLASGKVFPDNLTVRVSSPMIDVYQIGFVKMGVTVSGVHSNDSKAQGFKCIAKDQGNQCLDCRACWDKNVKIVSYHKH